MKRTSSRSEIGGDAVTEDRKVGGVGGENAGRDRLCRMEVFKRVLQSTKYWLSGTENAELDRER